MSNKVYTLREIFGDAKTSEERSDRALNWLDKVRPLRVRMEADDLEEQIPLNLLYRAFSIQKYDGSFIKRRYPGR